MSGAVVTLEAVDQVGTGVALPASVAAALWHADDFGRASAGVESTGWPEFDGELPDRGWPRNSVSEVLCSQPSVLEWRLLAPSLRQVVRAGHQVVVIGPPRHPHLPGLLHEGIDERALIWIQAETPAERLWVTEQLVKSNSAGAIVSWLPQARQEQLRRLQVCAHRFDGLVFLCRPDSARHEPSAAPLRIRALATLDWQLSVNIFKRRGPTHDGRLMLASIPGGLKAVLTPRLRSPSRLLQPGLANHVVGSPALAAVSRQHDPVH